MFPCNNFYHLSNLETIKLKNKLNKKCKIFKNIYIIRLKKE